MNKMTDTNILKKLLATITVAVALSACQPGAPIVKVLGEVGGFQLTEKIMTLKSKNSKDIFHITGKCFGSVSAIQVSFDDGATFQPLSQFATSFTMSCDANGTYTYIINPNNTDAFDIPFNSSYKDFKFRAVSDFGMSSIQNLRRQVSLGSFQITAGSGLASATISVLDENSNPVSRSATLSGRIITGATVVSGPTFVLKGAVRIK